MNLPEIIVIFDTEFNTPKKNPEIIQIAAVRINTKTEEMIDCFTEYVHPRRNTRLLPHIRRLTNIPQKEVDNAKSLHKVTEMFTQYLQGDPAYSYGDDWAVIAQNFKQDNLSCPLKKRQCYNLRPLIQKEGVPVKKYNSGTLLSYFAINPPLRPHNALHDVNNLALFLFVLKTESF